MKRQLRNVITTTGPWMAGLLAVVGAAACGGGDDSSTQVDGTSPGATDGAVEGTILVFAAASLTDAFAEIDTAFEAAHPGTNVRLNLAGTSALRVQILEGAPADVFAAADESDMAEVAEAEGVDGESRVFARNALEIAVPTGNPAGVVGLDDFADDELLIGLCAEGVPCGDLGRRVLANAGVEPSLDTNEPDVRALLTKIGAGELDAGIVYVTDVAIAGEDVDGIEIPTDVNVAASYPIAALAGAPNDEAARAFVDFVLGDTGQAILAAHGFQPPP